MLIFSWDTEQHVTAPNMITDNVKLITFSQNLFPNNLVMLYGCCHKSHAFLHKISILWYTLNDEL